MLKSKIKQIMEQHGVTILALVDSTRLSSRTIRKARTDMIGTCTLNTLETIARALGCSVKDLFEEVKNDWEET